MSDDNNCDGESIEDYVGDRESNEDYVDDGEDDGYGGGTCNSAHQVVSPID